MDKIGRITLICGPMFSGKTTEMIKIVNKYHLTNKKCFYIKHNVDNRYETSGEHPKITTHDGHSISAVGCVKLYDKFEESLKYDVIGIDEGQFFDDLMLFCDELRSKGKIVVISALGGNFERKMFNPIIEMIPKSDKVKFLKAVCLMCGCNASYTKMFNMNNNVDSLSPIIGGSNMFESVCNTCYNK